MNLPLVTRSNAIPATLADALIAASRYGHRPAVTALTKNGRYEQSYVSLAQWAAKGAHLLQSELGCQPGDRLAVCSRVSWHTTAIVLAAWWVGVDVTTDPRDAAVVIVSDTPPATATNAYQFSVGDAIDGAPVEPFGISAWTHEVRLFPDTPPLATCSPDSVALHAASTVFTHADLVSRTETDGVVGVDVTDQISIETLYDVAARPLRTGQRTVIVDRVARAAADAERITLWR